MRAKREERRKRNAARARARRMRALVLLSGMVLLVVAFAVVYGSSLFSIRSVQVEGTKRLTTMQVKAKAAVPVDATLLRLPASAIEHRLEQNAWVASASVKRAFPHTLRIVIVERRAVALLSSSDALWPIDRSGVVLAKESLDTTTALTVIRDVPRLKPRVGGQLSSPVLENALAVVSGISDGLRKKTEAVSAPAIGETTLLTSGGVEVLVGKATDLATKDVIAQRILRQQAGKVVFIDVRSTDRPVWRGLQQ